MVKLSYLTVLHIASNWDVMYGSIKTKGLFQGYENKIIINRKLSEKEKDLTLMYEFLRVHCVVHNTKMPSDSRLERLTKENYKERRNLIEIFKSFK